MHNSDSRGATVPFEELQELWQSQSQPDVPLAEAHGLAQALRKFGRRQNIINSLKVVLVLWQFWYILHRMGFSLVVVAGLSILGAGIVNILLADWRNQLGIARLDFTKPSSGFVSSALARLRDVGAPYRQGYWLNTILIGVGFNLLLSARWGASTPLNRLVSHLTATATPFAAYAIGFKIRAKRFSLECRDIEARLMALKQALEEQSL